MCENDSEKYALFWNVCPEMVSYLTLRLYIRRSENPRYSANVAWQRSGQNSTLWDNDCCPHPTPHVTMNSQQNECGHAAAGLREQEPCNSGTAVVCRRHPVAIRACDFSGRSRNRFIASCQRLKGLSLFVVLTAAVTRRCDSSRLHLGLSHFLRAFALNWARSFADTRLQAFAAAELHKRTDNSRTAYLPEGKPVGRVSFIAQTTSSRPANVMSNSCVTSFRSKKRGAFSRRQSVPGGSTAHRLCFIRTREAVSSRTLREIHIRVLANEHRGLRWRFQCG